MQITLRGQEFTLLQEKALYKPDESLLIIADVHLGKARHFRREGVSMPFNAQHGDYANLKKIFEKVDPAKVYFLGDLFHSSLNNDWYDFADLISFFPDIEFTLVKGNHDLINTKLFNELHIKVVDTIEDEHFIYTHKPLNESVGKLNIVGHIHPGFTLSGVARQSIKLPCFYIREETMILPAFGVLTGLYGMGRDKLTDIYLVTPGGVQKI